MNKTTKSKEELQSNKYLFTYNQKTASQLDILTRHFSYTSSRGHLRQGSTNKILTEALDLYFEKMMPTVIQELSDNLKVATKE